MSIELVHIENIEDADFWIPIADSRYSDERVVIGKPYKLFTSRDGEIAIIDEYGNDINLWLCHEGYFVKVTQ